MNYPFGIFYTDDDFISDKSLTIIESIDIINIFSKNLIAYSSVKNQLVCYYCFNSEQLNYVKLKQYDFHICAIGDDLFSEFFLETIIENPDKEVFWFPNENQCDEDIDKFIIRLKQLNTPISINYNKIINNLNPDKFRKFLFKINLEFDNPIINIEKNLINDGFNESNVGIYQKNNEVKTYYIVLGLFGDVLFENLSMFKKQNLKEILTKNCCIDCSFSNICINKGIGYIMKDLEYTDCISYKLLGV